MATLGSHNGGEVTAPSSPAEPVLAEARSLTVAAVRTVVDALPVAVELVLGFSLLHDDVIDGGRLRHHRPAGWAVFGVPAVVLVGTPCWSWRRRRSPTEAIGPPRPPCGSCSGRCPG